MQESKFTEGTIIKGKELQGYSLCKIVSEDMNMMGFQYKIGMNEDVKPLEKGENGKAGLHFCFVQDACKYLDYGTKLAVVNIPDDEDVYVDTGKLCTHRMEIKEIMPLNEVTAWEYLIKNGADIMAKNNHAVRQASENGYLEVVKCLYKNGADITAENNYAVVWAAYGGHLEVVKYLHENGADITADNNYAVRLAALEGHLEVIKYLHENGADIMSEDNYALRMAEASRYTDIVEYLKVNM